MSPESATGIAWFVWVFSWSAAASWSSPAAKRPARGEEWLYRLMTLAGAVLLFAPMWNRQIENTRFWDLSEEAKWVLFGASVLGFLFAWWARLHLGRLWSSSVTKKADHRIVETGPYGIVRHPIYTGIIAAAVATAALEGTLWGIAGVALWILGYWIKARLEERFLRAELGAEQYDAYRRRVPMLLPFGPKSR